MTNSAGSGGLREIALLSVVVFGSVLASSLRSLSTVGAVRLSCSLFLLFGPLFTLEKAIAQTPVQTFYVPLPEAEVRTSFVELRNGTSAQISSTFRSVISITAPRGGTILYYDHWENGFDPDITNPANLYSGANPGGTQIWGDNNPGNGIPPGFASDVIGAGDVIALDNDVDLPRSSSVIKFDGRDKLATSEPIAVSRAEWAVPQPGTVLAGAVETYPVSDFGTYYEMPLGEDVSANRALEYTALFVMASSDGTSVSVDTDGNGSARCHPSARRRAKVSMSMAGS